MFKGLSKEEAKKSFLAQIEGPYNSLLWKCYFSQMANKKIKTGKTERVAILGSSNIQPLKDMLCSVFHANNVSTEYYIGHFGNYHQELISKDSGLYSFAPTITILVLSLQDMVPFLYEDPFSYDAVTVNNIVEKASKDLAFALDKYAGQMLNSAVHLALIGSHEEPCSYVYSPRPEYKSDAYLVKMEAILWNEIGKKENIIFLNTRKIISKHSIDRIEDKRYWYLGRIRYADLFFSELAKEIVNVYKTVNYPAKKCLILDLDNTLWGGVVGQDGLENIILGQDGLGKAFQDFQREILKLYKKGIILAICSKNNEKDADEVFEKHSQMILKKEHFLSRRINWTDKVTNIKEIAAELNIGLDSMVFFEDDPAERKWVKDNLPQLMVPELPQDQFMYTEFLKRSSFFTSYSISEEDLSRNITYKAVAKTKDLKKSSGDIATFLKSLGQTVALEKLNASTISRAVQLCQKTNQFNLTTKRYQAADLKKMMADKHSHVYTLKVRDCFCDYGTVGLLILKESGKDILIDSFLLSCRIIGRGIESAILDRLKNVYTKKGYNKVIGLYSGTEKNAVCADIYPKNGFSLASGKQDKTLSYSYDLKKKTAKVSIYDKYIKIKV